MLACVDVEQVIARHAWLAGDTGRDDHQLAAVQGLSKLLWPRVALGLQTADNSLKQLYTLNPKLYDH